MTATAASPSFPKRLSIAFVEVFLVLLILGAAAYFRTNGLFWGEYQYLHPDERFLVWVTADISPVNSLSEYFDTQHSSLNPHNRGHRFFVYGTLPLFLARYTADALFEQPGWNEILQVGRSLSTLADLGTVLLIFLIGRRLYGRTAGLLAMAFSAAAVLQIQQAHFYTMDTFITFFTTLALYCAVVIATSREEDSLLGPSIVFGLALGMAVASKINAAPAALMLPVGMLIYLYRLPEDARSRRILRLFLLLVAAAILSVLTFRIFQPYAFDGLGLNPLWVQNIQEQRAQAGRDVDFPPAMQWARRPIWFSLQNMVVWGLGLPLGLLAWAGFLWAGWRLATTWRKDRPQWFSHALIWSWTAVYFAWQSIQLNPTMRYQMPIYPTLAIFAGWAVVSLYTSGQSRRLQRAAASAAGEDGARILDDRSVDDAGGAQIFDILAENVRPANGEAQPEETLRPAPRQSRRWLRIAALLVGGVVLTLTLTYAYAFVQIYSRPITRIAATRWIYQNVPGPINMPIETTNGVFNQIVPVPYTYRVAADRPFVATFKPQQAGVVREIYLPRVKDEAQFPEPALLRITLFDPANSQTPLATASIEANFGPQEDVRGGAYAIKLDQPLALDSQKSYALSLDVQGAPEAPFGGQTAVTIFPDANTAGEPIDQVLVDPPGVSQMSSHLRYDLAPEANGIISQVRLMDVADPNSLTRPQALSLTLESAADQSTGEVSYSPLTFREISPLGDIIFTLDAPIMVNQSEPYRLGIELQPQGASLAISGLGVANEGDWDDGLPLRMEGYDGFSGIYPQELNFNMYWDDNRDKLERFARILNEADYIVMSSNRQWGTLPRLPERFPMTSAYYRELMGCPAEVDLVDCYRVAEPGMFRGRMGFELVQAFTSEPQIGSFKLNDQFAEEAFSVYDHPKVLIFRKTKDYDPQQARGVLESVDLDKVVRVAPLRAGSYPATLMLPEDRWAEQQAGGTWRELFDTEALVNQSQILAVIIWYLTITLLGWLAYPALRLALPGLEDRGYPLARITGMLLFSYLAWLAGSLRVPITRLTLGVVVLLLAAFGGWLFFSQRDEIRSELRQKRIYFLVIEGMALALFLAFLLVRYGNPDLWHPWKGGEKPMDFSYFNAILKSTTFPAYDPWYAGGYLNYYYYGFVLVGMPVKLLGIVPAVAYNLILPTLFSLIALGAFSAAWNLAVEGKKENLKDTVNTENPAGENAESLSPEVSSASDYQTPERPNTPSLQTSTLRHSTIRLSTAYISGFAAALGAAVLGNLGTVRMIYQGFQRMAAPDGIIDKAPLYRLWIWAFQGLLKTFNGQPLPYGVGDWYWLPSRAIPAPGEVEPITEFPYFSVLYADLHAHLVALPLTLLALGLLLGFVLGRGRWSSLRAGVIWFGLAGLALGALRPTNTWDMPTYMGLAVAALLYTLMRNFEITESWTRRLSFLQTVPQPLLRLAGALASVAALLGLATLLFRPYSQWYALGYTKIELWRGLTTPSYSYLVHWGLFLFVIVSWLILETIDWMASTPASSLRKLAPYKLLIQIVLVWILLAIVALVLWKVYVAWVVAPLGIWVIILLLRPGMPDARRAALFMIGTGLILTLVVEKIVLVGDIGRMNTVFKFYLQAWVLFAVAAGVGLGRLVHSLPRWNRPLAYAWQGALAVLAMSAFLYTYMATTAKIQDRMAENAPHSLDGMAYMPFAQYVDEWGAMALGQDYHAIRWLQENVDGSPVIVEANLRNLYRWGSRMTIYTGLPGVVGWEWHQQQQRVVTPGTWVSARISEIDNFYTTLDLGAAQDFLRKYNVRYIIVGQQERGHYPGPGLEKFEAANGLMWREVYRQGDTVIYEVNLD